MNADVKRLWLEALRSGEYTQGVGALQSDGKFCCLGVLCDVAVKQGVDVTVELRKLYGADAAYNGATGLLPATVQRWSGLAASPAFLWPNGGAAVLTYLNDEGMPFDVIADVIELNL